MMQIEDRKSQLDLSLQSQLRSLELVEKEKSNAAAVSKLYTDRNATKQLAIVASERIKRFDLANILEQYEAFLKNKFISRLPSAYAVQRLSTLSGPSRTTRCMRVSSNGLTERRA